MGVRWKTSRLVDLLGDDRDELGRAAAGADDGDALAGQIDGVVPPGRVERRPGEALPPLDVRQLRAVELADRADHGIGLERLLDPVRTDEARASTVRSSSSYSIDETSVPKRMLGRMPNSSRHWRKYRDSSACG